MGTNENTLLNRVVQQGVAELAVTEVNPWWECLSRRVAGYDNISCFSKEMPYFFIFLYNVVRLIPSAVAVSWRFH